MGVGKIRSDGETPLHDGETSPLWRVLDLLLEICVLAVECDVEVASFAMMTMVVAGERLGLSDQVLQSMVTSAIAEARGAGSYGAPPEASATAPASHSATRRRGGPRRAAPR